MYHRAIVTVCVVTFLICSIVSGSVIDDIGRNKMRPKQFPQLSFALPALGLLGGQSRSNLFGKSTVTRTLLSTVSTITVASFRTCTTSAMALMPCGRRRRRDAAGAAQGENEIDASPSIKLIIGTTEITDPASVEAFFAENPPGAPVKSEVDMDNTVETTTTSSSLQRDLDGTTILYPSQDDEGSNNNDGVILVGDLKDESGVTTETPYSDDLDSTTLDSIRQENEEEDEKARNGLGVVTVTSRIPITHVVQTAASGTSNTLTIMYNGCLPPSLPVVGLQCAMA